MRQRIFFCLLLLLMLCACTRPAPTALERGETPDLWPRRTVFTETWTDLRAGREALWPVAEAETFKTRLAGLLTSVGWQARGITDILDDGEWARLFPGELRWASAGENWRLYLGEERLMLFREAEEDAEGLMGMWAPEGETAVLRELLALADMGAPAVTLVPGPDLTVGGAEWGMTPEEARLALPGSAEEGEALVLSGAAFCGYPVLVRWHFVREAGEPFLNGAEITFLEEPEMLPITRFDKKAVTAALEDIWGEREKLPLYQEAYYAGGRQKPPEQLWYWRTSDWSDGYGWKPGVVARFASEGGITTLQIDASGRNQASGRLTSLPQNEDTRREVERLTRLARELSPTAWSWDGFYKENDRGEDELHAHVYTEADRALAEELFAPYPWVLVELPGDQFREADASGLILDSSLAPASAAIPLSEAIAGWRATFTNRTEEELTLFLPIGLLAEREGGWVRPYWEDSYQFEWPTLAPGESQELEWGWLMPQCRYAFTPGQYLLTVATSAGTYAAPVEITE